MKQLALLLIVTGSFVSGCAVYEVPYRDGGQHQNQSRERDRDRDRDRDHDGVRDRSDRDRDDDGVPNRQDRRPDDSRRY